MRKAFSESLSIMTLGCSALLFSVSGCSRAPEAPPKTVEIHADDKMRFDVTAFEAKPGQKISVTLKNVGTTPKFSMGHNFIMLDRSVNVGNVNTFLDKASTEAAHDYVPPGLEGRARSYKTARTWRERHSYVQRAADSRRVSLSLFVSGSLLAGNQGIHDGQIRSDSQRNHQ